MKEIAAIDLSVGDKFKIAKGDSFSVLEGTLKDPGKDTVRLMIDSEWITISNKHKVYVED